MTKKKFSIMRTIKNLIFVVPSLFSVALHVVTFFKHEVRLAGKSLVTILICAILSAILLMASWFCLLALLFIYLTSSWGFQLIPALFLLLFLNLILLGGIGFIVLRAKKNMLFPATSYQIAQLTDAFKK